MSTLLASISVAGWLTAIPSVLAALGSIYAVKTTRPKTDAEREGLMVNTAKEVAVLLREEIKRLMQDRNECEERVQELETQLRILRSK